MHEPYETHEQTDGLCSGFDYRKPVQAGFSAEEALPVRRITCTSLNRDARTWRQPGTGGVKTYHSDDDDFLALKPTLFKWVCYIAFALTLSGVLPMAVCAFEFWLFDAYNLEWLLIPEGIGALYLMYRMALGR